MFCALPDPFGSLYLDLLRFDDGNGLLAGLDARSDDGRCRHCRVMAGTNGFGDLSSVSAAVQIFLSDRLLDPVDLVLVALAVAHGALLRLLQCSLKSLKEL